MYRFGIAAICCSPRDSRQYLGPESGEGVIKGTDFGTLEGDRLKTVIGFLDQVPAGS